MKTTTKRVPPNGSRYVGVNEESVFFLDEFRQLKSTECIDSLWYLVLSTELLMNPYHSSWAPRVFEIFLYLIYRLARAVVQLESDIYMLLRCLFYTPDRGHCCEVLYIVARLVI